MRKVVKSESVPESLGTSAKKNSAKFLCLLMAFIMFMVGCNPKKVNAAATPSPTAQEIMQVVSNGEDVPEVSKETPAPANTAEVTESTISQNNYFLFFPTEEELKKLEQASNKLEERLEETTDGNRCALSSTDYTTFQIMRFLSGNFEEVYQKNDDINFKNTALDLVNNILGGFYVTMSDITNNVNNKGNNKAIKSNITSPEFYKIFEVAGLDKYEGAETLKTFEIESESLYKAGLKGNTDDFANKSKIIAGLIEKILSKEEEQYKEQKLTSFYNMHPLVKLVVLKLMLTTSSYIGLIMGNFNIKVNETPDSHNLYYFYKIITSQDLDKEVKQEILNLIDAYIAIREQGLYEAYLTGNDAMKDVIRKYVLADSDTRLY